MRAFPAASEPFGPGDRPKIKVNGAFHQKSFFLECLPPFFYASSSHTVLAGSLLPSPKNEKVKAGDPHQRVLGESR